MRYFLRIFCEHPIACELFHTSKDEIKTIDPWSLNKTDFRYGTLKMYNMDFPNVRASKCTETSLGHGIVHLYRDSSEMSAEFDVPGLVVAILAIPSYMSPSDILGFLGSDVCETTSHIRLLQTSAQNRLLALLKFRSKEDAVRFREEFNGKQFSQLEPETCHVIYVDAVEVIEQKTTSDENRVVSKKPVAPPTPSLSELPTCVVCLERMDSSITGLLTIACQHTFHCPCLRKWGNSSCPVCRYTQKPNHKEHTSSCNACGCRDNLWMCLICGNIGCGRYHDAHAKQHFVESSHCYAMELESQRVWDYIGDNYVHRLLQSDTDGKLVELSTKATEENEENIGSSSRQKEMKKMSLEYTHILTSQLESQREYYEARLKSLADKYTDLQNKSTKQEEIAQGKQTNQLQEQLAKADSAISKRDSKLKKLTEENTELRHELETEKVMSENLFLKVKILEENLEERNGKISALEDQMTDLSEQLRDVMFTLSASQTLSNEEEDVKNGTIVIPSSPSKDKKKKNRRSRRS
ncbi:ubiquitin-protein ligase E3 [Schizosaccharomyces japonicus yFS275]|uniref:Ubiquitin-protein ligase E3 n=1 Tax=Schizosaccharomyces japonicus (strain yFS275 / FY16936) TaxID=402676 RepID=B6JVU3_SCHJY|nr:ubiquitin-protein ligase E3 [Schizosaccharomyces japonicus yFS275]EEB05494.1 ubiquitin-protein ligase E3 [Schizosaccharomyces japonicus yFS275]